MDWSQSLLLSHYLGASFICLVLSLLLSILQDDLDRFWKGFRSLSYTLHWAGILWLNIFGFLWFSDDLLFGSRIIFSTLLFTTVVNSVPGFRDVLRSKYVLVESWKFEDFIFFRGRFSKNHPRGNRQVVHALWPIFLSLALAVSAYDVLEVKTKSARNKSETQVSFLEMLELFSQKREIASNLGAEREKLLTILKVILIFSVTGSGLYVFYNHTLRSDYTKKWEILNKNRYELIRMRPKSQDLMTRGDEEKIFRVAEIQLTLDLIETGMWGHRSFSAFFEESLQRNASRVIRHFGARTLPRANLVRHLQRQSSRLGH